MVDCVDRKKRKERWSAEERDAIVDDVLESLAKANRPPKPRKVISRRIEGLGQRWSTLQHTSALYWEGWDVLIGICSREKLLKNPNAYRMDGLSKEAEQISQPAESIRPRRGCQEKEGSVQSDS